MGKFFSAIGGFFKKVFNLAPSWSQVASAALTVAGANISKIVGLIAGTDAGALSAKVIAEIQADLVACKTLIADAHGTNDAVGLDNALNSLNQHFGELLAAGHIKDAATLAKVEGIVNVVISTVEGVIALLPKSAIPAA
jgi:hypothetical protein